MLLHHTLTNLKLPNPRPWCSHCQDFFAPSCVSLELVPGQETCRFPASVWTPLFQTLLHSLTIELSPACHHVSTGNSFPQGTLALLSTWHTPSFPLSYSSHPLNTWEIFHLFPISVSTSILALYIFNLQYTNTDLCIWNLVGQLLVFPSGFIIFRRTVIFTLFSIISCSLCILEKNWNWSMYSKYSQDQVYLCDDKEISTWVTPLVAGMTVKVLKTWGVCSYLGSDCTQSVTCPRAW